MQIIEPNRLERRKKKSKKPFFIGLIVVIGLVVLLWAFVLRPNNGEQGSKNQDKTSQNNVQEVPKKGVLKTFSGEEFKNLYNSIAYPNTEQISQDTPITGNEEADRKIVALAEARGYLPRSAPVNNNLLDVGGNMLLQRRAATDWNNLVKSAKSAGREFGLPAAYRSADEQRVLFLDKLKAFGIPVPKIASGQYDAKINEILRTTAIPGYSRHHTGYTVDISCDNNLVNFDKSKCFTWLSANNYENAKKFGWIPSYPDGAGQQGPDPEAWEYVWVGKDAVTE